MSKYEIDPPDEITDEQRANLALDKSSLIESLESELLEESRSAPVSPESRLLSRPVQHLLSAPPLGLSVSTPSSPIRAGTIPRTSSVRDLVQQFETSDTLIMGDPDIAKAEAADILSKVALAKAWTTRYLKRFKAHDEAGTLTRDQYTFTSEKVQGQMDK